MRQGKQCVTQGPGGNRPKRPPTEQGQGTHERCWRIQAPAAAKPVPLPGSGGGGQERSGLWGREGGPPPGDVVIKAPSHGWNSGMVLEGRGWRPCFQRSLRQPPISTQHLPPAKANQKPEGNGASGWSPWDIECPCYHVLYPKCSHSRCWDLYRREES